MTKSFVLMAALPPTLGHTDLIRFAKNLTGDALVIVVTRGEEPYIDERVQALQEHFANDGGVTVDHLHLENIFAEGNPYWADMLREYGFRKGDYLVASEAWGEEIAQMLEGEFFPYDVDREIRYTKATAIRNDLGGSWGWIIPEFQRLLQKRIVIFGAESTGKTTLMRALRDSTANSVGVFEYARPLLEMREGDLDVKKMMAIWRGQKALQATVAEMTPVPRTVFLDTDLWTTAGYWQFWQPETVPSGLLEDAKALTADLYILVRSNIPFEKDPIRYGGDEREQTDDYWRGVLEANGLPFVEIPANELKGRLEKIHGVVDKLLEGGLTYERQDLDQ